MTPLALVVWLAGIFELDVFEVGGEGTEGGFFKLCNTRSRERKFLRCEPGCTEASERLCFEVVASAPEGGGILRWQEVSNIVD